MARKAKAPEVRQVHAVGIASTSSSGNDDLSARIEEAMHAAVRECLDAGITDPDAQRERMLAAREAVLNG